MSNWMIVRFAVLASGLRAAFRRSRMRLSCRMGRYGLAAID